MEPIIIGVALLGIAGIIGYARHMKNNEEAYAKEEERQAAQDEAEAAIFKNKLVVAHGIRHTPKSPIPVARNYVPKAMPITRTQSRPSPSKPSPSNDSSLSSALVGAAVGYAIGSSSSSSSSSDSSSSSSSYDSSPSSGGDFGGGGSSDSF